MLGYSIYHQTFLFLMVTMAGVLQIAGEFKEIRATVELEHQTWDNLRNRPRYCSQCINSPCNLMSVGMVVGNV